MEVPIFAWELEGIRSAFTKVMLTDTAQIQRQVNVPTGRGGQTRQYVLLGSVPCRLEFAAGGAKGLGKEGSSGDAVRSQTFWEVTFDAHLTIQPEDRIVINGLIYEPVNGLDITTNQLTNVIGCRRLDNLASVFLLPNPISSGATTQAATLKVG